MACHRAGSAAGAGWRGSRAPREVTSDRGVGFRARRGSGSRRFLRLIRRVRRGAHGRARDRSGQGGQGALVGSLSGLILLSLAARTLVSSLTSILLGAAHLLVGALLLLLGLCLVICLRHDLGRRRHWRGRATPRYDTHRPLGRLFPGRNWLCPRGTPRWFCRPPRDTGGWACIATIHFPATAESPLRFLGF